MADNTAEDPRLDAARVLLEQLIRSAGWKLQEIDAQLGFNRGWVGRVIHGDIRLGYEHILQILDVIGVDPHLYFSTLHPTDWRARSIPELGEFYEDTRALAERVLHKLPTLARSRRLPSDRADDFEERMHEAVRAVLAKRRGRPRPDRK